MTKAPEVIELLEYSHNSVAVVGTVYDLEGTRKYIKELGWGGLGGRFNPRLKTSEGGTIPGWIFPKNDEKRVRKWVETGELHKIILQKVEGKSSVNMISRPSKYITRKEYELLLERIGRIEEGLGLGV